MRNCLTKPSRCLEIDRFTHDRDCLRERRAADAKGAFDGARLAADVACEIIDCGLAFAKGPHHLKSSDRGTGGLQRFEAPHWTNQLL